MQAVSILRNGLIFAGLAVGGALAILGAVQRDDSGEQGGDDTVAEAPIVLNTAKPPDLGKTPLAKPISLESPFGRSELTGLPVNHVPDNPLEELDFDRRWDVSLALKPPKPPSDLPPEKATDEVLEPEPAESSIEGNVHLDDLPNEARSHADAALINLRDGTRLLKEGMIEMRRPGQEGFEGAKKVRDAADLLRDARDKLEEALKFAPQHAELLRLMQEVKANLYICLKHGR
ncbi:MAG: hypothetical protein KDB82_18705 [Planctomycetes bacterium]|nr:hypothetical protein [Planctomycetota bacterium]